MCRAKEFGLLLTCHHARAQTDGRLGRMDGADNTVRTDKQTTVQRPHATATQSVDAFVRIRGNLTSTHREFLTCIIQCTSSCTFICTRVHSTNEWPFRTARPPACLPACLPRKNFRAATSTDVSPHTYIHSHTVRPHGQVTAPTTHSKRIRTTSQLCVCVCVCATMPYLDALFWAWPCAHAHTTRTRIRTNTRAHAVGVLE